MKNFKVWKTKFFNIPAIKKWFPKVLVMKKIFSQCYLALKQPKNAEKCHVFGSFKPVFSISTQLFDLKKKGVSHGSIKFWMSKYERKHQKVHWIDLHSTGNALVKHLFFHVFSQKISKIEILEKKSSLKLDFDSCNTNCFRWYFELKIYCLILFCYIRPFSGLWIGPRMQ